MSSFAVKEELGDGKGELRLNARKAVSKSLQLKLAFYISLIPSSQSAQNTFSIKRMIIFAEFPAIGKLFFTGYVVCNWNKKSRLLSFAVGFFIFS